MTIALLVVDDHSLIRAAVREVLARTDLAIVAEAATAAEALRLALEPQVQVMLLDLGWLDGESSVPSEVGLELLEQIRSRRAELPILMYSGRSEPAYVRRCRELGARGYVIKGAGKAQLVSALNAVYAGEQVWPDQIGRREQSRPAMAGAPARPPP